MSIFIIILCPCHPLWSLYIQMYLNEFLWDFLWFLWHMPWKFCTKLEFFGIDINLSQFSTSKIGPNTPRHLCIACNLAIIGHWLVLVGLVTRLDRLELKISSRLNDYEIRWPTTLRNENIYPKNNLILL